MIDRLTVRTTKQLLIHGTGLSLLYLTLYLHDRNLYPHLELLHAARLSGIRLVLLLVPVGLAVGLIRYKLARWLQGGLLAGLFLLLPYTLYASTEVRHIAELCRLPEAGTYYVNNCLSQAWTLLPVLLYSVAGTLLYGLILSRVVSQFVQRQWYRYLAIVLYSAYAGLATVFGLYSRLNIWEIFLTPTVSMQTVFSTLGADNFFVNGLAFGIFAAGITFATSHLHHVVTQNKT